jgi:hypothetical protein
MEVRRQVGERKYKRWLDTYNYIEQYTGGTRMPEAWKMIKNIKAGERNRT